MATISANITTGELCRDGIAAENRAGLRACFIVAKDNPCIQWRSFIDMAISYQPLGECPDKTIRASYGQPASIQLRTNVISGGVA
jgi:hypothetical protein